MYRINFLPYDLSGSKVLVNKDTGLMYKIPPNLVLRDFQKEAVDKMLYFLKEKNGVYNASDVGCGKSVMTACTLNMLGASPVLIIAPAVMLLTWREELLKWGTQKGKIHVILNSQDVKKIKEISDEDIVIISYDRAAKDINTKIICERTWGVLVADESHMMKERKTTRAKQILGKIWLKARYHIANSGTPFTASVCDGWTLFNKFMPQRFPRFYDFAEEFAHIQRTNWGEKYIGCKNPERLREIIRGNFFVRYLKSEVLKELPDKIFTKITLPKTFGLDLTSEEKKIYEAYIKDATARLLAGVTLPLIPESVSNAYHAQGLKKTLPVVEFCMEMLEEEIPLILFGWHTAIIERLAVGLKKYNPVVVTGKTSASDRYDGVQKFQNGETKLFIGNMLACGTGITLTRSSTVVFAELNWTPAVLSQCIGRAHRITQKDSVNVYYFVVEESIDEEIISVVMGKVKTFEEITDHASTSRT